MGKTLQETEDTKKSVAEIEYFGEKLVLPKGMAIPKAIDLLERRMSYEKEETEFSEDYDVFPFDGAHALAEVLIQKYGWAPATATPGWFGPNPPKLLNVQVGFNQVKVVPWGRFSLPNINGYVECSVSKKNGRFIFSLSANVLRGSEPAIRDLCADVREYLKTKSIYKGKAIKIRFRDDDGEMLKMPEPSFLDTASIDPNALIYAKDVQDQVETNLFTPILRLNDCLANGIPVKRGILLGGIFGTGKTLAATVASHHAVNEGITYVYIPRADELSDAIEFAKQYQTPKSACVIFCEDIDRVTSGERSVEMDDILNILDGIDTKSANIITVLTTNDLDSINPALLRPGRLDAVINVTPPDAQAVEKLIRYYGGEAIDASTNLAEAGTVLAAQQTIPAVIAEVVKRAKLSELRLLPKGEKVRQLSEAALLEAAKTIAAQVALLAEKAEPEVPTLDQAFRLLVRKEIETADAEA